MIKPAWRSTRRGPGAARRPPPIRPGTDLVRAAQTQQPLCGPYQLCAGPNPSCTGYCGSGISGRIRPSPVMPCQSMKTSSVQIRLLWSNGP
ncbi:MAG: hypothetical protein QOG76_745, partial [Pseudonocardiales bacterium]|nr:hypothetical protein [Pseudonocardiales bacterium]